MPLEIPEVVVARLPIYARALASFKPGIPDGAYELWQVVNAMRPFTRDVAGCLRVRGDTG